jgi:SPP1 family phage portal protein
MFLDSLLKTMDKQEIFAEGLERRISILKTIQSKIVNISAAKGFDDLEVGIEFNDVLPQNVQEIVDMLYTAAGANPIMSQQSAVNSNPLVEKPDEVIAELKEEAKEENIIPGSQNF